MEFQVRTVYTEETVEALVAVNRARTKRPLWARIVAGIAAVLFLAVGAVVMGFQLFQMFRNLFDGVQGDWDVITMICAALMIGSGIGILRPPARRDRETARNIWKSYRDKDVETIFRFTPEGYWYKTPVSECSYAYSTLSDFWTDGSYYFLFLNARQRDAYVLKYTDFTMGDPAAFAAALGKWTGKTVNTVTKTS